MSSRQIPLGELANMIHSKANQGDEITLDRKHITMLAAVARSVRQRYGKRVRWWHVFAIFGLGLHVDHLYSIKHLAEENIYRTIEVNPQLLNAPRLTIEPVRTA